MKHLLIFVAFMILFSSVVYGQGNAFSFQGKLNDGTNPANGRYDLEFKLFDAVAGGTQIGPTVARPNTILINGVFSVVLDFGAQAFQNPNSIYIEIAVKPFGSPNAFTILGPRQQLTVVPFASRAQNSTNADISQNSLQLGGLAANKYAKLSQTVVENNSGDLRISGAFEGNKIRIGPIAGASNDSIIAGDTTIQFGNLRVTGDVLGNGGDLSVGRNLTIAGQINSNVRQDLSSNGLVKAMLYINSSAQMVRCYNGITNTSTGNCGFTVTTPLGPVGVYRINFGFPISDRFVSVSVRYPVVTGGGAFNMGANFREFDATSIEVFTFPTEGNSTFAGNFMLILY